MEKKFGPVPDSIARPTTPEGRGSHAPEASAQAASIDDEARRKREAAAKSKKPLSEIRAEEHEEHMRKKLFWQGEKTRLAYLHQKNTLKSEIAEMMQVRSGSRLEGEREGGPLKDIDRFHQTMAENFYANLAAFEHGHEHGLRLRSCQEVNFCAMMSLYRTLRWIGSSSWLSHVRPIATLQPWSSESEGVGLHDRR